MKRVAVLLSGCGVFDGTEVHEGVLTLLAIAQAGAEYECFAPNEDQMHVVNHLTGEVEESQQRNVLIESARIARGEICDVSKIDVDQFDALIVPGGFGVAKNLSDYAVSGADCEVKPQVIEAVDKFKVASKPVGFMCIAPIMIPRIYGPKAKATIGNDEDTAFAFNCMGGQHESTAVDNIVIDEENKIVSTPAYMLANSIIEANAGISKLVNKVIEMI
ncbi:isoprenoid biosynthesis glyoxalase ElbB [Shewanella sp. 202IG2-18]|uniref:isoprenoid biosynthesis glyoxalase ElbB n=1 Tax=Parashewanella hymeniacidonis TaxID=2807618 RepID=UPI00195FBBE5|nr:isoprenoid biosynthesis glyoxalase ElbB [Parashewanella hymeniacidonis]MBM7072578.1 isoprenoid biosynthesis glyoxalase ElbB [Parashewanella hymeniacidonis]